MHIQSYSMDQSEPVVEPYAPIKWSYKFSEMLETHAVSTYKQFLIENEAGTADGQTIPFSNYLLPPTLWDPHLLS